METNEQNNEITTEILLSLDELQSENSETNDRLLELQEYFKEKDEKEEQAEQENIKAQEEEKKLNDEKSAEEQTTQETQNEVYTQQLTEINQSLQLTNQLLAVQGVYIGIIIGFLFVKILFDRLRK